LDTETTLGIGPLNGIINACDHAGAAFQTARKLNHHLSFLIQRIEVCGAGINAKPFFAALADLLVESNVRFFVVLKGIESQFIRNPHSATFL
jgi:hypothetical protein